MAKVRFSCPRCQAVMQTNEEKIGFDIQCPQCSHRFTLVEQESPSGNRHERTTVRQTAEPTKPAMEETRQWVDSPLDHPSVVRNPPSTRSMNSLPSSSAIPPIYQGHSERAFCCPFCQTRQPPIWKSEISTAGWITSVLLLCTTCFFFWVGFLIRDKYMVCSVCKVRLPRSFS